MGDIQNVRMKAAILIGDSIRRGYQPLAQEYLAGKVDAWGPPVNGGDSRNVLGRLDEWCIGRSPDVVHINCGLHDVSKEVGGVNRVPLDQYAANVRTILGRLRSESGGIVIWATTTPVNEQRHRQVIGSERLEADVVAYNEAAEQVADDFDIQVNDLFGVAQQAGRDRVLSEDGVHFTPEGYAILAQSVATVIREGIR